MSNRYKYVKFDCTTRCLLLFLQIKQPVKISFSKFSDSIINPGEIISDFTKFDRAGPLHFGFRYRYQLM